MKKSPVTTNLSEKSSIELPQTKNIDFPKAEEEEKSKTGFKNPIKLKKSIQESANVNQIYFSNKSSYEFEKKYQQRSQRTNSMRETQKRNEVISISPASKEMMRLNEKLASMKSMLDS